MSDYGDLCRDLRDAKRDDRRAHGVPCPECRRLLPKACPTILLPQQRCRIHGYHDSRPRTAATEYLTRSTEGWPHDNKPNRYDLQQHWPALL